MSCTSVVPLDQTLGSQPGENSVFHVLVSTRVRIHFIRTRGLRRVENIANAPNVAICCVSGRVISCKHRAPTVCMESFSSALSRTWGETPFPPPISSPPKPTTRSLWRWMSRKLPGTRYYPKKRNNHLNTQSETLNHRTTVQLLGAQQLNGVGVR